MHIDVKAKDTEGNLLFEGTMNQKELSFCLQYAINDLMAYGVQFNLDQADEGTNRMTFPKPDLND